MKKPFPDWYRRLDPLLDGYKTNAIWEAFYERRNNHSKRMFRRTKLKGSMSPGYIFASILLALVTVVLFIWIGCCGLLPLFLLLPLLQMGTVKKTITGAWLPFDLRRVFGSSGVLESAAIDIWQTGASGRTIFEALYIEQRASQWLS